MTTLKNLLFMTGKMSLFLVLALNALFQTPAFGNAVSAAGATASYDHCDDAKFIVYDDPYFRGDRKCFDDGEYYGGKHCSNYYGKSISFRIKKGYQVWLYDRNGRLMKKFWDEEKDWRYGFHKFVVRKYDYDDDDHGHDDRCDDAKFIVYDGPYFRGDKKCFDRGEYYGGKHCSNYYGKPISFRIKNGYQVWLYDRNGRLMKKFWGEVKEWNYGFHKFVVREYDHDDDDDDHGHGDYCDDAKFVVYNGSYFRGDKKCFDRGEYYSGKHCQDYYGKPISFKVRNGYQAYLYDRSGRLIKKCGGEEKEWRYGFHKLVVRKYDDHDHDRGDDDDDD